MNKKTDSNKIYSIIIICLISVLVASIVIGIINSQKQDENTGSNADTDINIESKIDTDGIDSFIEKNVNNISFLQLVGNFSRNEKIEYCISKIMKTENVSGVSVEKIANYYVEIFGDDKNDSVADYLRIDNLNNYQLNEETNEYVLKENSEILEKATDDNVKFKIDSKIVEQNQVIVKFRILQPRQIMEYCSYFVNKRSNNENDEKYREIEEKLNDIRIRYDNTNELTQEDIKYLLELAEEDVDNLAYVSDFEVVIEKEDNRFIIKDVKEK